MKAAVYYGPDDIRVEEIGDPKLEADGILVQVKACGICGSDLHLRRVVGRIETGLIMGHEFSGDVIEVGDNVTNIRKGERVTAASVLPCGECSWCRKKQFQRCSAMKILGFQIPGAFAECVSIPLALVNATVFPLPDRMSYQDGATLEPLSVAVHAAKRAAPTTKDTVVILGAGMIGQCTIQVFKAAGVAKVIVSEIGKRRLEVAKTTGADVAINAAEEDPVERVSEITSGMGADIVVECAGTPETFQQATKMVRSDGKIILVGIYDQPLQWDPLSLIQRNVSMIGCFAGSFSRTIDFWQTGKVDTKPLISHEFPLDKAGEAFETQLKADESVKVLIKP